MPANTLDPLDPSERKDYAIDWSTLLAAESEVDIDISTWSASTPAGLTINSTTTKGLSAIIWVSGGVAGRTYGITNTILTSGLNRTHQRTIFIPCKKF